MNAKKHIILTGVSLMCALAALGQNMRTANGTVIDENGQPVIGATVIVAGQPKTDTVTDIDGKFKLNVPAGKKIQVSYIGYMTQSISKISDKMRIVMKEDDKNLNEVVVVGYGALKQKNVTGAVEVINPEELKDLSVSNLSEALIGLSPSLHVSMPSTGRSWRECYNHRARRTRCHSPYTED